MTIENGKKSMGSPPSFSGCQYNGSDNDGQEVSPYSRRAYKEPKNQSVSWLFGPGIKLAGWLAGWFGSPSHTYIKKDEEGRVRY